MNERKTYDVMRLGDDSLARQSRGRVLLLSSAVIIGVAVLRGRTARRLLLSGAAVVCLWPVIQKVGSGAAAAVRDWLPGTPRGHQFADDELDIVDEASLESFPASDPTSFSPNVSRG